MLFLSSPEYGALFVAPAEANWRHKIARLEDLADGGRLTHLERFNQTPRPVSDPDAFSWISPSDRARGGIHRTEICVKLPGTPYILPTHLARFSSMLGDMIICYANSTPFGQPSTHTTCWLYLSWGTLRKGDVSRDIAGLFHTDLQLTHLRSGTKRNTTNVLASDAPVMMTQLYFKPLVLEGYDYDLLLTGTADETTAALHRMCRDQFNARDAMSADPLHYNVYDGVLPHHGLSCPIDNLTRTMNLAIFSTDGHPRCHHALESNPALAAYIRNHSPEPVS